MVKIEEIIELGFTPAQMFTRTDQAFVITNRCENPNIPWMELMVIYDSTNGSCAIFITDTIRDIYKKNLFRGDISSIEQLEEKLIELNGKY
jgi:hypothetical protein